MFELKKKLRIAFYILTCVSLMGFCFFCNAGSTFPPDGKPIDVSNTANGITVKMTIGVHSYSGKVEFDPKKLPAEINPNLTAYKILLYVETDKLYIHPFLGNYAVVGGNGDWRIKKVDRNPPPSAVYAFLVPRDTKIPDTLFNKGELKYIAEVEWYKK